MGRGYSGPQGPQPETRRDLGFGRGPIARTQTSKEQERVARRRRKGGGGFMATGASRRSTAAYSPAVVAPGGTCEFLGLCTMHESRGAARGLGPTSSAASALRPRLLSTRAPEAFRLFLTSPLPPSPITRGRLLPGAGWVLLGARRPLLAAPATKFLSSCCRLCLGPRRLGLRSEPPPSILPQSSGQRRAG